MTLIKCPSCSRTVSSVASKCPGCGFQLTQPRFQQGREGSLTECRKCGRKVFSKARTCPYCGANRPGRRNSVAVAVALTAVTVPVLVLLALQQQAVQPLVPVAAPAVVSTAPVPAAPVRAARPPSPRPRPAAIESVTTPPQAPPEEPAGTEPVATEPVATETTPDLATERAPLGFPTQTRWVSTWANVREGRALGTAVVRVLPPGLQVEVADRISGWWTVYLEGQRLGYVAGSALVTERPDTVIPHSER